MHRYTSLCLLTVSLGSANALATAPALAQGPTEQPATPVPPATPPPEAVAAPPHATPTLAPTPAPAPTPPATTLPLAPAPPALSPTAPAPPLPQGDLPLTPLTLRGSIGLDTATFTDGGDELAAAAVRVLLSIPLSRAVFLDARLPSGFGGRRALYPVLGNVMLGAHGLVPLGRSTWLSVGGAIGVPLLSGRQQRPEGYASAQLPNAFWNLHEYSPSVFPIELRLALERSWDLFALRAEVAPVLLVPVGDTLSYAGTSAAEAAATGIRRGIEVELAVLHAIEAQVGRAVSGGLRLQGVALPTYKTTTYVTFAESSTYQAAVEPFVAVRRPGYFFRAGFLVPVDDPLGFSSSAGRPSYGVRLGFGVILDEPNEGPRTAVAARGSGASAGRPGPSRQ